VLRVEGFDILRCPSCHLRFVPIEQVERVDYDQLYSEQGEYSSSLRAAKDDRSDVLNQLPRARRVAVAQLERIRPATLLDVGCGTGTFLAAAERLGIRTFGSDVSRNALDAAGARVAAQLHHGILTADTFEGRRFDVVCSWEVLEHVAAAKDFVRQLLDRIEPGGWIFLSTPNYDSRFLWRDVPADPRSRPPVHVTFWNAESLSHTLASVGLMDVRVRHFSIPASAARRSGRWLDRYLVYPESILQSRARQTLLAVARRRADVPAT
jgi:2-polyprenyl-3-methyl-5-hydroxy-6-metoxy-1,4-benzoquinol methylase